MIKIMSLKIEDVAAQRSFVFLWCGSCEGLDLGRQVCVCVPYCVVCCVYFIYLFDILSVLKYVIYILEHEQVSRHLNVHSF